MVKEFTANCSFSNGMVVPIRFYVGNPSDKTGPIHFQAKWLGEKKGGMVPESITKSLMDLQQIAIKNRVNFEELFGFVINEINTGNEISMEQKRINNFIEQYNDKK